MEKALVGFGPAKRNGELLESPLAHRPWLGENTPMSTFSLTGVIFLTLLMSACPSDRSSSKRAAQFVKAYYLEDNLQKAEPMTDQLARRKVQKEMIKAAEEKPKSRRDYQNFEVDRKLNQFAQPQPDQRIYFFRLIDANPPTKASKTVRLVLEKTDRETLSWKVIHFAEI